MTDNVPSPCIKVCTIDEDTGYCKGCLRTAEEVADWPLMPDTRRMQLLLALEERKRHHGTGSEWD